jgi:hypothetical protein
MEFAISLSFQLNLMEYGYVQYVCTIVFVFLRIVSECSRAKANKAKAAENCCQSGTFLSI